MSLAEFHDSVQPVVSKSQKRKAKRNAAGRDKELDMMMAKWDQWYTGKPGESTWYAYRHNVGRKPRNRGASNVWPIERLLTTGPKCGSCKGFACPAAIRHLSKNMQGQQIGPVVRFAVVRQKSVFSTLCVLRFYASVKLDYNVIFMIMRLAFESEVFEKQLVRSEQVHTPCGCRYHKDCYIALCTKPHPKCKRHRQPI